LGVSWLLYCLSNVEPDHRWPAAAACLTATLAMLVAPVLLYWLHAFAPQARAWLSTFDAYSTPALDRAKTMLVLMTFLLLAYVTRVFHMGYPLRLLIPATLLFGTIHVSALVVVFRAYSHPRQRRLVPVVCAMYKLFLEVVACFVDLRTPNKPTVQHVIRISIGKAFIHSVLLGVPGTNRLAIGVSWVLHVLPNVVPEQRTLAAVLCLLATLAMYASPSAIRWSVGVFTERALSLATYIYSRGTVHPVAFLLALCTFILPAYVRKAVNLGLPSQVSLPVAVSLGMIHISTLGAVFVAHVDERHRSIVPVACSLYKTLIEVVGCYAEYHTPTKPSLSSVALVLMARALMHAALPGVPGLRRLQLGLAWLLNVLPNVEPQHRGLAVAVCLGATLAMYVVPAVLRWARTQVRVWRGVAAGGWRPTRDVLVVVLLFACVRWKRSLDMGCPMAVLAPLMLVMAVVHLSVLFAVVKQEADIQLGNRLPIAHSVYKLWLDILFSLIDWWTPRTSWQFCIAGCVIKLLLHAGMQGVPGIRRMQLGLAWMLHVVPNVETEQQYSAAAVFLMCTLFMFVAPAVYNWSFARSSQAIEARSRSEDETTNGSPAEIVASHYNRRPPFPASTDSQPLPSEVSEGQHSRARIGYAFDVY